MKAKTIISIILAAIILCGTFPITASAADHPNILRGDTDLDGEIAIIDVTLIQRHLAEFITLDELSQTAAHCDFRSDELDITDATMIQRWLADISDKKRDNVGLTALIWDEDRYIPVEEDYQRYLDEQYEANEFSGVTLVTKNGRVLCQKATGYTDVSLTVDITMDSLFLIGSVSKQFCASAIMLLQEQGLLDTSDTLDKYYPDYAEGKDVTLRDMLTMQSGIPEFAQYMIFLTDDEEYEPDEYEFVLSYKNTKEENIRTIIQWVQEQELDFTPGKRYSYCNTNYLLLADIVQKVSGMPYAEFMKQNVFAPLGMNDTGFYEDYCDSLKFAHSTSGVSAEIEDMYGRAGHTFGAGDIVSCASDIDKWLTSLQTGKLLSSESIAEMTEGTKIKSTYGYGLNLYPDGGLWHGGAVDTYLTYAYTHPDYGYNIFVVTNAAYFPTPYINSQRMGIEDFGEKIRRYTFEQ